ncbi:hypothetical protein BAUCODRAFT_149274 [Baudoinia panamericana UAMH 10762]|uniref:Uncharacterized protein n=1 Tax=Baudoinia panamericana (strain UAMH 10762) TaxID=717646 RepID=M2MF64_BAUPA|nr:uncharacterized protein BAUCODRAFT_149274 [Baudoinia panamericana UAMH 10762]EMC95271.1 hypothetical protein BAUCODRAFT_149274 [Baudoinia panamericana UAMH 10762]
MASPDSTTYSTFTSLIATSPAVTATASAAPTYTLSTANPSLQAPGIAFTFSFLGIVLAAVGVVTAVFYGRQQIMSLRSSQGFDHRVDVEMQNLTLARGADSDEGNPPSNVATVNVRNGPANDNRSTDNASVN